MSASRLLAYARLHAGLSQRELAERAGMTQSAIARIESGRVTPRFDTLARLVRECGSRIDLAPIRGAGEDLTLIHALRRLPPEERLRRAAREALEVERFVRATRRRGPGPTRQPSRP